MKVSRDPMLRAWVASLAVTALVGIAASRGHLPIVSEDTPDYFLDTYYLKLGYPGTIRTPGIPLLAGLFGYWWGLSMDSAFFGVMILSIVGWLASVWFFGKTAQELSGSRKAAAWCMVAFGCFPPLARMAYCALAESLCISLCAIFFYQFVKCLRYASAKSVIALGGWILALILLKPIFIILLLVPALMAVGFVVGKKSQQAVASLCVLTLIAGGVWAYSGWWKDTYGFRAISIVNTINNTALAQEFGIFERDDFELPETRAVFCEGKSSEDCAKDILAMEWEGLYPRNPILADCHNAVTKPISRSKTELVPYFYRRFLAMVCTIPVDKASPHNLKLFSFLRLGMVIPLMLITLILFRRAAKERWVRLAFVSAALLTLAWLGVIWIGAEADWGRLFLPAWSWLVIGTLGCYMGVKNWYEAR